MLINCPECSHQVSDKAPICPHCGVELAKVLPIQQSPSPAPKQEEVTPTPLPEPEPKKKSNSTLWLIVILLVMIALGGGFMFYNSLTSNSSDEEAAYTAAMNSDDVNVLQSYLIDYKNMNPEHRDAVQEKLTRLNEMNKQWNDVLVAGSRSAYQQWIDEHPNGPYKLAAEHKVDSLDWASAMSAATVEAIKSYTERHPDGEHADDAAEKIRNFNATTVQPDEKMMVQSVFRSFFRAINTKDEDRLTSNVASLIHSFLGKSNATKSDVVLFMSKLWKDDVVNLNWHLGDEYQIEKKEIGNEEYEYTVSVDAQQIVEKAGGSTTTTYRVSAKLNTDGKITDFGMKKIIE